MKLSAMEYRGDPQPYSDCHRECSNLDIAVMHIQHVADSSSGIATILNRGTEGVKIHNSIVAAAPDAPVVIKNYAERSLRGIIRVTIID